LLGAFARLSPHNSARSTVCRPGHLIRARSSHPNTFALQTALPAWFTPPSAKPSWTGAPNAFWSLPPPTRQHSCEPLPPRTATSGIRFPSGSRSATSRTPSDGCVLHRSHLSHRDTRQWSIHRWAVAFENLASPVKGGRKRGLFRLVSSVPGGTQPSVGPRHPRLKPWVVSFRPDDLRRRFLVRRFGVHRHVRCIALVCTINWQEMAGIRAHSHLFNCPPLTEGSGSLRLHQSTSPQRLADPRHPTRLRLRLTFHQAAYRTKPSRVGLRRSLVGVTSLGFPVRGGALRAAPA
jgi:hypothetical protein